MFKVVCTEIFNVSLFKRPSAEETIYRSKAVGEPPLMLAISAWCALRDACASLCDYRFNPAMDPPATPERVYWAAQQALGGTVDSGAGFTVGTGQLQGKGDADAVYIFSHEDKKLLVYFQNANRLELLATRNCQYDLQPNQYGKQNPSVADMKKGVSKK